jgi:adenylosuccinate lyase
VPFNVAYLRCLVLQVKWLLKLSQIPEITEVPPFSEEAQLFLNGIIQDFSIDNAKEVKKIEKITNHDVKAVEYFLKQRCSSNPEIEKVCWPSCCN